MRAAGPLPNWLERALDASPGETPAISAGLGIERQVSVLFCDLLGFTKLAGPPPRAPGRAAASAAHRR